MKKIILILLFFSNYAYSQSITILPSGLQNFKIATNIGKGLEHNKGALSYGTYLTSDAGWFQTHTNDPLVLSKNNLAQIAIFTGIVNYVQPVKFGSDAPAILLETYTGATSTTAGQSVSVLTNYLQADILNASLVVDCGAAGYVPQGYSFSSGYLVELRIEDNYVYIINKLGNSANILNKPFKLFLTHK
jgi:hypothetical protein